jgi:RNA polymerase sigma-70 factor (ECF subfamily)
MRDVTLTDVERLTATVAAAPVEDVAFQMDEDTFRAFYERTARSVWIYLSRITGDAQAADDLLQETYYRFLRAERVYASDAHRKNYLFRIAANLVRDARRRHHITCVPVPGEDEPGALQADGDAAERSVRRTDLTRAMARLKPRERDLLWLAYAQGSSHQEIAESLGLKTASIKLLLFRARRHLATLLRGGSG